MNNLFEKIFIAIIVFILLLAITTLYSGENPDRLFLIGTYLIFIYFLLMLIRYLIYYRELKDFEKSKFIFKSEKPLATFWETATFKKVIYKTKFLGIIKVYSVLDKNGVEVYRTIM